MRWKDRKIDISIIVRYATSAGGEGLSSRTNLPPRTLQAGTNVTELSAKNDFMNLPPSTEVLVKKSHGKDAHGERASSPIHCHPRNTSRPHVLRSTICWCRPKVCPETGVVFHDPEELEYINDMFKEIVNERY